MEVLSVFFFSVFGIYALVGFMEDYLESPLNVVLRILSGIAGVAMLWPHGEWWISSLALVCFLVLFIYSRLRKRDSAEAGVTTS